MSFFLITLKPSCMHRLIKLTQIFELLYVYDSYRTAEIKIRIFLSRILRVFKKNSFGN